VVRGPVTFLATWVRATRIEVGVGVNPGNLASGFMRAVGNPRMRYGIAGNSTD